MTDSPPSTTASTPSTEMKAKLKKFPQIHHHSTCENSTEQNEEIRVSNSDDDDFCDGDDEASPIAASMLGLNSIRTRSVPINLRIPSLVGSPPNNTLTTVPEKAPKDEGKGGSGEKRENAAVAGRKKFVVPDNTLSSTEIIGLLNLFTFRNSISQRFEECVFFEFRLVEFEFCC